MLSRAGASRALVLVALAALGLHALLFTLERAPEPRRLWGDEIMYADLAERGARGEPAEIELLWPPLYPRLLSLAARLGPLGTQPPGMAPGAQAPRPVGRARAVVALLQLAALVVAALALRAVARGLAGSVLAGDIAAALLLLDPQVAAFAHYLWPEALHLALFLGTLALLMRPRAGASASAGAGLLLGLALLTKSLLQPLAPLLAALVVARRGLRQAALMLVVALAVVAPAVIDNGRRAGVYTVADSARFNLWVGLNDRAPRNFHDEIVGDEYERWRRSAPTFAERQALLSARIDAFVRERGVPRILRDQFARQYYRLFGAPSFLDDQLPGGAIARAGYGYVDPPATAARLLGLWSQAHYALLLVAAAFGAGLLPRLLTRPTPAAPEGAPRHARRGWLLLAVVFVAYNLLTLLFLHVKTRYRLPLVPFLDVAAAVALSRLVARGTHATADGAMPTFDRRALTIGALLAALLLKLAFFPPAG